MGVDPENMPFTYVACSRLISNIFGNRPPPFKLKFWMNIENIMSPPGPNVTFISEGSISLSEPDEEKIISL